MSAPDMQKVLDSLRRLQEADSNNMGSAFAEIENALPAYSDHREEHDYTLSPLPQTGGVPFYLWESIAYDIALDQAPAQQICQAYDIKPEDLLNLIEHNAYFNKVLTAKKQEVAEAGSNATMVMKFRMMTNMAMSEFARRLTSKNTPDKEFHSLFRTALELARYMPDPRAKNEASEASAGVVFNLYNMPGLDHLSKPQTIVDVTPNNDEVIITGLPLGNDDDGLIEL